MVFNNVFIFIMFILTLSACSKSEKSVQNDEFVNNEAQVVGDIGFQIGEESEDININIDLGLIDFGKTLDGTVSLRQQHVSVLEPNGLNESRKFEMTIGSHSAFSIIQQSGCVSIKRTIGNCSLKIRANGDGLSDGQEISGQILIHNDNGLKTFVNVFATHGTSPIIDPAASIVETSSSIMDFGSLTPSSSPKDLVITFKALRKVLSTEMITAIIPSPFSIIKDGCSNKNLSKSENCSIKVRLNPNQLNDMNIE